MSIAATLEKTTLTTEEKSLFREQGYLGPYTLCSPGQMANIRADIEHMLYADKQSFGGLNRHLDVPFIYRFVTDPAIIDRMTPFYGPDLQLWRTGFFIKEPDSKEIPWHQDGNFWPFLEPTVVISAWIAIDPSTIENGCFQVIPGARRKALPHIRASENMTLEYMVDPQFVEEDKLVNLEMKPGEFIIFHDKTLHHSEPNRSNLRRMGMVVRIIIPSVKVLMWDGDDHSLVQICGEDRVGHNRVIDPPF